MPVIHNQTRIHTLALISLILTSLLLLVVLAVIHSGLAMGIFAVGTGYITLIRWAQPGRVEQLASWWNNMSNLVHWGLIVTDLAIIGWLLAFFLKNLRVEVKIVPNNNSLNGQK